MKLHHLLAALPAVTEVHGHTDLEISGLVADSRRVQPGYLFVAYRGVNQDGSPGGDGHRYIPDALRRGAVAVVGEVVGQVANLSGWLGESGPTYVRVPQSRLALAHLAAAWQGFPARQLRVIGVTGTDGKTTTVTLIRSILEAAGHRTGMIGTVAAVIGEQEIDTGFHTTTPDAPDVQAYLAQMVAAGCTYAVLEATSHGLDQDRVAAGDFDAAVLTNVTPEHLNYHRTFEAYREAKARLFRYLATAYRKPGPPTASILNRDDPSFDYFRAIPAERFLVYGLESSTASCDVTARAIELTPQGTRFLAVTPLGDFPVATPLLGRFNVYNCLAAIATSVSQNLPVEAMQRGLATVRGIVGRMEVVTLEVGQVGNLSHGQLPTVIVDFAHTPSALEASLTLARRLTAGRVIAVFGAAGLRDREKRPRLGEVAARLADVAIITAEDPRTEPLDEIMAQVAAGLERAGRREGTDYYRIGDRAAAIAQAVHLARPEDLVIICGKGHERSMCFGETEVPWSDQEAARRALREKSNVKRQT
ncbi:MAG: UDP-N-acetylmuramoyl-L-alanyl-D-glutamate--2,6-diaminopimelate ligase [Chloroflexi bacterium]|nr:UDP-N-acetylmuramoyl-L-alanyl-D-glutamate--2,6-diaminopimelate ligase [Chloroflexota bacterium]